MQLRTNSTPLDRPHFHTSLQWERDTQGTNHSTQHRSHEGVPAKVLGTAQEQEMAAKCTWGSSVGDTMHTPRMVICRVQTATSKNVLLSNCAPRLKFPHFLIFKDNLEAAKQISKKGRQLNSHSFRL